MNREFTSTGIAARIWILTSLIFGLGWLIYFLIEEGDGWWSCFIAAICAAIGSLPVLVVLLLVIPWLERMQLKKQQKIIYLGLTCFICTLIYGIIGGGIFGAFIFDDAGDIDIAKSWVSTFMLNVLAITTALFACSFLALLLSRLRLMQYFSSHEPISSLNQQNNMETTQSSTASLEENDNKHSNRTLIKGIITGVLILVMMIPTLFIINLVRERQARQKEVANEVSSKWASAQTLTGPYLYVPYTTYYRDKDGKVQELSQHIWLLPDNLEVSGIVEHQIRPRSIYKVLLYKANLQDSGNFILQLPKDVNADNVIWSDVKICYGLSDFKGIEERLAIKLNNAEYELSPGLPSNEINEVGLSANIALTAVDIGKNIPFNLNLKIKGSEQLHFIPMAGNSNFSLQSSWANPSFDGNNLPTERNVNQNGFSARWTFNKANLPFGTVLKDFKFDETSLAFGVTMLQPADQYAKTERSVKYAILFIGLTFALFFIIELMQQKPIHPVQYVLIGLALIIFYTLLLSISEFILFDYAYAVAALATISIITLYAWSHFKSWKSAGIFGGVLSVLYGFIFVLIRLEDTALLVGSIGLFIVLALVMYASRKINWYGTTETSTGA